MRSTPRMFLIGPTGIILACLLLALPVAADVVLHPGRLSGTVLLTNWQPQETRVALSGNDAGYSTSTSVVGTSFALVTEGNQLYRALSVTHYFARGYLSFASSGSYYVPAGSTLQVNLERPGGTIVHKVQVTGGRLVSAYLQASAFDTSLQESYSSYQSTSTTETQMPMVAQASIHLEGRAEVAIVDAKGQTLCTTVFSLAGQQVSLAEGQAVTVNHVVDATGFVCSAGGIFGAFSLRGIPEGLEYDYAYVAASGPSQYETAIVNPAAPNYRMEGLQSGLYSMDVTAYFQASKSHPWWQSLYLPLQNANRVNVLDGQMAQRDFPLEAGLVKGKFVPTDFLALRLMSSSTSFRGVYDSKLPGGGPTAGGGTSTTPQESLDRTFQTVLTPGVWQPPVADFSFTDSTKDPQDYYISYTSYAMGPVTVTAGQTVDLPLVTVANSRAIAYFDVVEEPAAPQVLMSHPRLYGSRVHKIDNDYAWVRVSKRIVDKPRIPIVFVGPRGQYQLEAYADVSGSYVRFSASVLDIGTTVLTPEGNQVQVKLQDGNGLLLPVQVKFDAVVTQGGTTGNLTDMGPAAPDGYELLEIAPKTKYLFIDSTAVFKDEVEISVAYSPQAVDRLPWQEQQLVLQQFVCKTEEDCEWVSLKTPASLSPRELQASSADQPRVIRGRTSRLGTIALMKAKNLPPPAECEGFAQSQKLNEVPLSEAPSCITVRLSGYNVFLLGDYSGGHDVQGKVAAGGNISMTDFAVGAGLADGDISNTLSTGGDLTLSRGGIWGDAWYGGSYSADPSVMSYRGAVSKGTDIDFAARGTELRCLSAQLAGLTANGTTTRESWGGIILHGTDTSLNVFNVDASAFTGAALLSIDAPGGSLAVVNIHGASATFTGFGHSFSGGIDQHGILYNFVDATSIDAHGYGFWGTVLAPYAHMTFNDGSFDGGIYGQSLSGNAEGHINALQDRDICQGPRSGI